MEQFSLEKYLENPSRKVVTRDGRPVRIVCWDRPGFYPIIGYTEDELNLCISSTKSGFYCKDGAHSQNDLFFADEELTEFEKRIYSLINFSDSDRPCIKEVKEEAKIVLDLARTELLKDLPKWKKATENKDFDTHVLLFECENEVVLTEGIYKDEYYIELEDLKSLPKE